MRIAEDRKIRLVIEELYDDWGIMPSEAYNAIYGLISSHKRYFFRKYRKSIKDRYKKWNYTEK